MTLSDTFDLAALTSDLTLDEGRSRLPYSDTRGCLSIGIGHNLTGRGLSEDAIDFIFAADIKSCCLDLDVNAPWWRSLPPPQQRVMLNMCFNLGWPRLAGFVRFLAAMQRQQWQMAADELRDSLWFGQVGSRGPRVVARLLADGAPIA